MTPEQQNLQAELNRKFGTSISTDVQSNFNLISATIDNIQNGYLPLSGGTMSESAAISFQNGSRLVQGTTDQFTGGNKGISLRCSLDYELNYQAGRLTNYEQDGSTVRTLPLGSPLSFLSGSNILDSSNINSIDPNARILHNANGDVMLDWNGATLTGVGIDSSVLTEVYTNSANWNDAFSSWNSASATLVTKEFTDSTYLPLSGGKLTGSIGINNDPLYFNIDSANIGNSYGDFGIGAGNNITINPNTNLILTENIGNVGIGTITPTTKLDVNGVITVTGGDSNKWNNVYSSFNTQSANNASVYTTVNSNSASNWNYQGTDIKSLTGNWQNTFTNFSTQSANNLSVYSTTNSNSANNVSVYTTVNTNSATWASGTGGSGGGKIYYFNQAILAQSPTTNLPLTAKQLGSLGLSAQTIYTSGVVSQLNYTLIAGFVTDALDPNTTTIPGGIWDFNVWGYSNANTNNPTVLQVIVYTYDGINAPVLLSTSNDAVLTNNGIFIQQSMSCLVPQKTVSLSDRIYVEIGAKATANNKTVTLAFGDSTPSHLHSTIPFVGGTGLVKVVDGVTQTPASLLVDVDVASAANINQSKISGLTTVVDNVNSSYTTLNTQSANNLSNFTTVNSNSANWNSVYSNTNSNSANNMSVYSTVNTNSAVQWNYQGTDVKSLTASWQNTYTSFSTQSANNNSVYTSTNTQSANNSSVYSNVNTLSANWNNVYTTVRSNSATTWQGVSMGKILAMVNTAMTY